GFASIVVRLFKKASLDDTANKDDEEEAIGGSNNLALQKRLAKGCNGANMTRGQRISRAYDVIQQSVNISGTLKKMKRR
ncbi:hypothetical protein M8C21_032806, partial [Ambrosia artemisiifolia]